VVLRFFSFFFGFSSVSLGFGDDSSADDPYRGGKVVATDAAG
jgi:hypothetical protein